MEIYMPEYRRELATTLHIYVYICLSINMHTQTRCIYMPESGRELATTLPHTLVA